MLFPNTSTHQESISDVADTLHRVSQLICKNWNAPLSSLDFLGPRNWENISRTSVPTVTLGNSVMGDILEKWSRETPDALAVEAWDGSLTYKELHRKVYQMATLLHQKGVQYEERIGICIRKSKWSIVTFWGILVAGCTGVPLDIRNPRQRLETLLKTVKATKVVTDEWVPPGIEGIDVDVIRCGIELLDETDGSKPVSLPEITPKTIGLILFTSGSTGIPKGVVIQHGPLYASVVEIAAALYLDKNSRSFQFASFVSDISMGDIFTTMYNGGCVCVPSEEQRMDNLPATLAASRATHATLTSSVMNQVKPEELPHLRYMIAVGEAISKENVERLSPHFHLISAYGIAESIIYDSFASPEHLLSDYRNIGQAKGPCLWVTDQDNPDRLRPIGAVGEIIIEGPLLAQGYMGDPRRTAEKFIELPPWLRAWRGDSAQHGCYRSGDYGIRNADGTVLYLGRADLQVKIRGQRVEIGEIEYAMRDAEPSLTQVAVEAVPIRQRGNVQTLVAFGTMSPPGQLNLDQPLLPMSSEAREAFSRASSTLLKLLPQYMVPSIFIPLPALPRNAAGKRDRKVLRAWALELTEEQIEMYQLRDSSNYRAPDTPEEVVLQKAWAEVLRAPEVTIGAEDNFFQVGGDSIKAIELVAYLRRDKYALSVSQIFQSPTLSELAEQLTQVEGDDILDTIPAPLELLGTSIPRQTCLEQAASLCNVNVGSIEDIYPAVPLQEALMAITSRRQNVYTYRLAFKLPSSIQLGRFKKAWEALVANEAILRTRIVSMPEIGTVQVVLRPDVQWKTDVVVSLADYIAQDNDIQYGYGTPLNRCAVVGSEQKGDLHFVWSGHHAISDGWSRPLMFNELKYLYLHGSPSRPPVPYTPFIREIASTDRTESDEFWLEQFPSIVEPFPRLPNPHHVPHADKLRSLDISIKNTSPSKITRATLVQAAWAMVVTSYGNSDEAVFGLTLSGRDTPVTGITDMIGLTIATVPVRIVPDNTSTLLEYLEDVQQYLAQVKQHQHSGMQNIQRLSPEARSAVAFQSLLVVQPFDESRDHDGVLDLGMTLVEREDRDTDDLALTLSCTIGGDGNTLHIKAHFDGKVLEDGIVECMLFQFEHILQQLATESDSSTLYDLDRTSPHDLSLWKSWNKELPSAVEETLHGLFERKVEETPDALALEWTEGSLTYAELNNLSDKLANHLREDAGIVPESRVLLCFTKSHIPIVAMIAILKAGGACVSTNPEHPTARLLELNKDVQAAAILCDESFCERFADSTSKVIGVSELSLVNLPQPSDLSGTPDLQQTQKSSKVLPSNASFIVYTSGSTGKPKGSVLEHRSLATDMLAVTATVGVTSASRTLQFSAYTFDAHILEIIGTLIRGGCVCVVSEHERMNQLQDVMNKRRVTFALLTKTVSRLIDPEKVPALEALILSGEANGRQDYWRWANKVRLFNGLGPSECTPLVCLTRRPVSPDDEPSNIGHSIGCHVWVTDHRKPDRLVPVGCVGELTVEGPIVGRGYVNRPKETAHSFVLDPAWSRGLGGSLKTSKPRRFYRSGDLVKANADGSITFLGRADSQVKINGQRVELGEVEDQLRRCSSTFTACAVETLKVSGRGGATVLAVFCSVAGTDRVTEEGDNPILSMTDKMRTDFMAVQSELFKVLPSYMVPSRFIPVTGLPFNASGKLERKKLTGWVSSLNAETMGQFYLADQVDSRPPETDNEKQLQALWAEVLDIPHGTIHLHDNFFRMGGDSVLSMRLVARARAQGVSMTVADIFKAPTLKEMATLAMMDSQSSTAKHAEPVEPMSLLKAKTNRSAIVSDAARDCGVAVEEVEDIYPCHPTQEALMAVSSHRPKAYTYQVILKVPNSIDTEVFKKAWEVLIAAQPVYRTRIVFQRDIGSLQVVLRSSINWHIRDDCSVQDYLKTDGALLVEYGSELCKYAIIKHEGQTNFVVNIHHALYDGWSLMRTYEILGDVLKNGASSFPLAPYTRFFSYLSEIDEGETDDYWRRQLTGSVKTYPQLPNDQYLPRPRSSKMTTCCINRKPSSEVTLATVIQAAWSILMSKYSDSKDIVFGLMSSGRDVPVDEIEHIVGPTIATVPLRVQIDSEVSLGKMLGDLQKQIAEMRKYQHAGLHRIRRVSEEASAATDFQNLLVVHTMGDTEITRPLTELGLEAEKTHSEEFLDLALTVECTIRPGQLQLLINYDSDVVPEDQVTLMLRQLEHITSALLEQPETTKLKDLVLSPPQELELVRSWNSEDCTGLDETMHHMFEVQAEATPDAVAIVSYETEYTYKQLNDKANQLASHLVALGVRPEIAVVLCFKRSAWPLVAILAVLKSGGISVSLNHDHPLERRLETAKEVDARVVICDAEMEADFLGHVSSVVTLNDATFSSIIEKSSNADISSSDVNNLVSPAKPSNAAFIVFTSGSTGKPKGCVLEHRSVSYAMNKYCDAKGVSSKTRMLHFSAYSFDLHIIEMFATWFRGGCVCCVSDDERLGDLVAAINDRGATWIFQTPTMAEAIRPEQVPAVDTIIIGGEPLTRKALKMWSLAPGVRMMQFYAPSETSNSGISNPRMTIDTEPRNLGKQQGCHAWIVESENINRLALVGCVGELLIESPGLARTYLNRPDATEKSFISDPEWSLAGRGANSSARRFYRTGDIVCFLPDGSIKFVGRRDTQVKIRGQRVELQEIEHHIQLELPAGSQIVVDTIEQRGTTVLAAFVRLATFSTDTQSGLSDLNAEDAKNFQSLVNKLGQSLPDKIPRFMVPSTYIPVSVIPTSTSTKADRRALKQLAKSATQEQLFASGIDAVKQQPTNSLEEKLRTIWAQILNLDHNEVGIEDPFMSLGGDSITAMQVVSECRKQGVKLQVTTILREKTIKAIAPRCSLQSSMDVVPLSKASDNVSFELSPIQRFYFKNEGQKPKRFCQGFLHRVKWPVSSTQLRDALDKVVKRHSMLRARFYQDEVEGTWLQKTLPFGSDAYRFHCGDEICNDEDLATLLKTAACSIDVVQGPVFSVDYFSMQEYKMVYMIASHLVVDLVSWRIIWQDLEDILRPGAGNLELTPPLAFQDWTLAQKVDQTSKYATPLLLDSRFDFWGVSRKDNLLKHSEKHGFELDLHNSSLLMGKANDALDTKPLDIMGALLLHSFKQTFTERDVPPVFVEHHGRATPDDDVNQVDLSQTVGWFTAISPVNIEIEGTSTPMDAICRFKDTMQTTSKREQLYLSQKEAFKDAPAEIMMNFSGLFQQLEADDGLLQLDSRPFVGEYETDLESSRLSMIDVEIGVSQGIAQFNFHIHSQMAYKDRIVQWISAFRNLMVSFLPTLVRQERTYTLSDFPRVQLTYEELEDLQGRLVSYGVQGQVKDIYPCTSMQEGILLSQQTDKNVYLLQSIWEFKDHPLLARHDNLANSVKAAWKTIAWRHPSLRTGILEQATSGSHFLQVVLDHVPSSRVIFKETASSPEFPIEDSDDDFWTHLPHLTVCRTETGTITCCLRLSHVLMDGMSTELLMKEFVQILTKRQLYPSPMEFGNYVEHERSVSEEENASYWAEHLKEVEPCHVPTMSSIATGGANNSPQEYGYLSLAQGTTDGLADACQRLGVTQAALLQLAWAVVLGVLTGQKEVCFGYLASARDAPLEGIEESIGLYISMQVCRVKLAGTVNELARSVHDHVISGLEHRKFSLARIQSMLGLHSAPLFNTCMTIRRSIVGEGSNPISEFINPFHGPEKTEV